MTTKAKEKPQPKVKVFQDLDEINRFAAEKFIALGNEAIKKNGRFTVALAGGTTPVKFYRLLLTDEFRERIDWEKVCFFFGDERDVSPISEMSNFKTANENFLKPLEIPTANVFRWHTEIINAAEVAESYERALVKFFGLSNGAFPRFDLILLGMGDDGHTASLFPHTPALGETKRLAVSNYVEKLDANRLTLTFPVINNAANVIFLVSGAQKAKALGEVLKSGRNCEKFPAQCVRPADGELLWLIDARAAENTEKFS